MACALAFPPLGLSAPGSFSPRWQTCRVSSRPMLTGPVCRTKKIKSTFSFCAVWRVRLFIECAGCKRRWSFFIVFLLLGPFAFAPLLFSSPALSFPSQFVLYLSQCTSRFTPRRGYMGLQELYEYRRLGEGFQKGTIPSLVQTINDLC